MSEIKPPPKKMVSRNVAVALGIICIILVVGLVGALAYYMPIINDKNNTISSLNTQISQLATNNTNLHSWLNGNITAYNNEVNQYNAYVADHSHTDEDYNTINSQSANSNCIINLNDSTIWVDGQIVSQGASQYSTWNFSASCAGYVSVFVQESDVSGTCVEAIYSAYGVNFNQEITVGVGFTANFPILPSSSILIGVGNGNDPITQSGTVYEVVTITYYY